MAEHAREHTDLIKRARHAARVERTISGFNAGELYDALADALSASSALENGPAGLADANSKSPDPTPSQSERIAVLEASARPLPYLIHFVRQRWEGQWTYTVEQAIERWLSGEFHSDAAESDAKAAARAALPQEPAALAQTEVNHG